MEQRNQGENTATRVSRRKLIDSLVKQESYFPCPKIAFLVMDTNDLTCGICLESGMRIRSINCDAKYSDHAPAILPCGHVAGLSCLERWLDEHGSCPFCREELLHELCLHSVEPQSLYYETIHGLPKTLPEGGRIADQCEDCSLRSAQGCARLVWSANKEMFTKALEQYKRSGSNEHLAKVWKLKNYIEELQKKSFANAGVDGNSSEW